MWKFRCALWCGKYSILVSKLFIVEGGGGNRGQDGVIWRIYLAIRSAICSAIPASGTCCLYASSIFVANKDCWKKIEFNVALIRSGCASLDDATQLVQSTTGGKRHWRWVLVGVCLSGLGESCLTTMSIVGPIVLVCSSFFIIGCGPSLLVSCL